MTGPEAMAVMGLQRDDKPAAVRAAWRKKASGVHPDLGHSLADYLTAKAIMETALAWANRLRPCPDCDGLGQRVKQNGFRTQSTPCRTCRETGKVAPE